MVSRAKRAAHAVTPPIVADAARRVRRGRRGAELPAWEVAPEGWAAATALPGWDVDGVVTAARARLPEFRAALTGSHVLGMGTEAAFRVTTASVGAQQEALVLAYALLRASRTRDHVSVLDWGGGLGFSGLLARSILPDDVALDYHCREHSKLVAAGRGAVPEVQFCDDDGCFDRTYDLVVASSSLQYAEDWQAVLARFARVATGSVLLTRVPVVGAPEQDETRAYLFDASATTG